MHRDVYLTPSTLGMRVFSKHGMPYRPFGEVHGADGDTLNPNPKTSTSTVNSSSGYGCRFENFTCGPRALKIQCEVAYKRDCA